MELIGLVVFIAVVGGFVYYKKTGKFPWDS